MTKPLLNKFGSAKDRQDTLKNSLDKHLINFLNNNGIYDRKQIESIRYNPTDDYWNIDTDNSKILENKTSKYQEIRNGKSKKTTKKTNSKQGNLPHINVKSSNK